MEFTFADLFSGAGGATTGVLLALSRKKRKFTDGVAINHWPLAVETHSVNHPRVRHLCESIERVDPCEAVPGGRLELLWASPECTHHSRARGAKPRQNQSRAGASHILTWLDKLYVKNVIIENVPEFEEWGPLNARGEPIKAKRGENFRAFIESLRARNYNVDYRVLNAADYGDATTRRRLFVIARRMPLKIVWPEPTHRPPGDLEDTLFSKTFKPWRPARDIIDWKDLGKPLSQRPLKRFVICRCEKCKREWSRPYKEGAIVTCEKCNDVPFTALVDLPLSPNTMRRIIAGLQKFCGIPFIVGAGGPSQSGEPKSTEAPIGTVTGENHRAVVSAIVPTNYGERKDQKPRTHDPDKPLPSVVGSQTHGLASFVLSQQSGGAPRDVKEPLPTAAAGGAISLVNSFLLETRSDRDRVRSVDKPLQVVTADSRGIGLINSFLVGTDNTKGNGNYTRSVDNPVATVVTKQNNALVSAFVLPHDGVHKWQNPARQVDAPLPTATQKGSGFLVSLCHGDKNNNDNRRVHDPDKPIPTLTKKNQYGLIQSCIVTQRGTDTGHVDASAKSVEEPISTVTAGGTHHALVSFIGKYFGTALCQGVDEPLHTVATKDRFLLVNPHATETRIEIYFRLLKWRELASAHTFPKTYKFRGNKTAIVKQIGNSNPVELTAALTACVL